MCQTSKFSIARVFNVSNHLWIRNKYILILCMRKLSFSDVKQILNIKKKKSYPVQIALGLNIYSTGKKFIKIILLLMFSH